MMTTYPGNLFVVAAPSGAGKSSLVKALMELDAGVQPSVSHTTRAPRGQEFHGREYFFIANEEFDRMVADQAFLEWAHVHGNRYGTSRATIEEKIAKGMDVILEIDFQGAVQIKRIFANAVLIFILPPSMDELRARLQRRGEDSPEVIELRLENSAQEMAQANEFDYVIINQLFDKALFDLKAIVHAQRLKYASQRRSRSDIFQALNLI
ncbi:MAG: putative guanylate kinase kinase [Pseudomonadota bacterium]|jgi:guanylate kinase